MSTNKSSKTPRSSPEPLSSTRFVRFYKKDYDAMLEWEQRLNASTGLTVVKMLRDAVSAGWPIVEKQLKEAAGKEGA